MREEKGCFEEEYRGRNWGWERDKLKNRWGIDGSWTGNLTRTERELNGGERRVNGNQTGIKQKLNGRPR